MRIKFRRLEFVFALVLIASLVLLDSDSKSASSTSPTSGRTSTPVSIERQKLDLNHSLPTTDVEPQTRAIESDTTAIKPKSAEDLSFVVRIVGKNVEFQLTNQGEEPHLFFDSLKLGWSGMPLNTWIQVLTEGGELYEDWPVSLSEEGDWSPNYVSNTLSDVATRIPAELQTIEPGDTRSLVFPIEKFFERSGFDREAQGYRVRVVSNLYLDAELTQRLKSRSDWVPLEF